ncbi:MAG: TIGR02453 family protein [gamma proteobacterium symbiont of Ctena orbiculata]|nr:MAG: TIGR02453 family protein [gamma proteobacterium symbiont of Ctena orbiculata]
MERFKGFPQQTLPFLTALAQNNDRTWFADNKQHYESYIREPALVFIEEMAPKLRGISGQFRAVAKKTGGSLMRVYRDTRFSKDKRPYKTNIGIQFRHNLGKDIHAPGFYLHIEPGDCFIGAGIWHPEPKTLAKIRNFITDNPAAWQAALKEGPFRKHFQLAGDSLVRPPRGFAADHPLIEDLKRKDFIALKAFDADEINKPSFCNFVTRGFKQTDSLMRYLCTAVEVNY